MLDALRAPLEWGEMEQPDGQTVIAPTLWETREAVEESLVVDRTDTDE